MMKTLALLLCCLPSALFAQSFSLEQQTDTNAVLVLTTPDGQDRWQLDYPVYRFCVADVNGDGQEEAVVGVIKTTRFFKDNGRRLFVYKNYKGNIRSLWMGSRIGGEIQDFMIVEGKIRCITKMNDKKFSVPEFVIGRFGPSFVGYIADEVDEPTAWKAFNNEL